MTYEEAQTAAAALAARLRQARPDVTPERLPDGKGLPHALFMLDEVARGMSGNKSMRWLGYAQAILVYEGALALDEAKEANRAAVHGGA